MKITSRLMQYLHLDKTYSLLTGRNVRLLLEMFKTLDIHDKMELNDIQFFYFMRHATDLDSSRIYRVFDMLDVDGSGEIDFDEFYLLMCILIAVKDNEEKQFIYRHSRTVFDLLDEDGSNTISAREFENFGFLFNLQGAAVKKIFNEFDVSGDKELDYKEFRMFAMACIDKQQELDKQRQQKEEEKRRKAYLKSQRRRGELPISLGRKLTSGRRANSRVSPDTSRPTPSAAETSESESDSSKELSQPRQRLSEVLGNTPMSSDAALDSAKTAEEGDTRFCLIL